MTRKVWRLEDVPRNYMSVLKVLEHSLDTIKYWGTPDDVDRLEVAYQHVAILKEKFERKAEREKQMKQTDKYIHSMSYNNLFNTSHSQGSKRNKTCVKGAAQ